MKFDRSQKVLLILFIATLPFVNPLVGGDGVGYYAYVRALVVQHNLRFENDWLHSASPFIGRTMGADGRIGSEYTATGHLANRYSVGPSLLWAPFLIPVHLGLAALAKTGVEVARDGFSLPYLLVCAFATALYGFLGLWISHALARRYTGQTWSLLATIGLWLASSLPVYMYFNPFYSHAQSVFAVAAFVGYWQTTRDGRSPGQWLILGLLAGLMLDVYYLNVALLAFPVFESLKHFARRAKDSEHAAKSGPQLLAENLLFVLAMLVVFLPTLITRKIIYGSPWIFGYEASNWAHPVTWQPLLSSNHGLISWTPIIFPALVGLVLLWRRDREFAAASWAAFGAMYYVVASHPDWHGISSFGNRFFISLTPLFIVGLAIFLQDFSRIFSSATDAVSVSAAAIFVLVIWNLAFIFQWGTGLVPHIGPISWRQMAYNQVHAVPARLGSNLRSYFTHRVEMMQQLEQRDMRRPQQQ